MSYRSDMLANISVHRVANTILQHIDRYGDSSRTDERSRVAWRDRQYFDEALERLTSAQVLEVRQTSRGWRIRKHGAPDECPTVEGFSVCPYSVSDCDDLRCSDHAHRVLPKPLEGFGTAFFTQMYQLLGSGDEDLTGADTISMIVEIVREHDPLTGQQYDPSKGFPGVGRNWKPRSVPDDASEISLDVRKGPMHPDDLQTMLGWFIKSPLQLETIKKIIGHIREYDKQHSQPSPSQEAS